MSYDAEAAYLWLRVTAIKFNAARSVTKKALTDPGIVNILWDEIRKVLVQR